MVDVLVNISDACIGDIHGLYAMDILTSNVGAAALHPIPPCSRAPMGGEPTWLHLSITAGILDSGASSAGYDVLAMHLTTKRPCTVIYKRRSCAWVSRYRCI